MPKPPEDSMFTQPNDDVILRPAMLQLPSAQ